MTDVIRVMAGKTAYRHIRENGLSPSDIRVVLGASGAAKWLTIYGLDLKIFEQWFKGRTDPLHLFGTSIGAWKFAAAAQKNPRDGLDRLKAAYIHQYYAGRITPDDVARESRRIMAMLLPDPAVAEILSHPYLRIGFSAVRCRGLLGSRRLLFQALAMGSAFKLNLISRKLQKVYFHRTLFHHPRYDGGILDMNDFSTTRVPLTPDNFNPAILASGSIPLVMHGVTAIPDAPAGTYRDGGLLDYHPVFPMNPDQSGLILYPHFYNDITPGWFDKVFPGRRAKGPDVDRVVLVSPSPEYVSTLPFGRIPDRKDFKRLMGKDDVRVKAWTRAAEDSLLLGDAFMELTATGRIRQAVQPLP